MPDEISYFYPAFSFKTSLFFCFKLHLQLNFLPFSTSKTATSELTNKNIG